MEESNKHKILVVVESIDVEDSSGSKANVALILNLYNAGYEVIVYHYSRKQIDLPNIPCYAIEEKKYTLSYFLSRLQRKIQHFFKINLAKYLERWFGFSFTFFNDVSSIVSAINNLDNPQPDLVVTLSKGASFRPHMALLKLPEFHEKWMAYIHDPYPFHNYPVPYKWSEPGYQKKIEFFERVFSKAKWLAFPSLLLQNWMMSHYSGFENKGLVIPHQISFLKTVAGEIPEFFDKSKFTILHAGNLMAGRPPYALLEAYKRFVSENPQAKEETQLIFLGQNSSYKKDLIKFQSEVKQLIFSDGYLDYHTVQLIQQKASVNIIIESIAEISPFLPGKFPHCVAAEKPIMVLGPAKSEVRRLLGKDYKYHSELNNAEKIKAIIKELYQEWKVDPGSLILDRPDLVKYLSSNQLRKKLNDLLREN